MDGDEPGPVSPEPAPQDPHFLVVFVVEVGWHSAVETRNKAGKVGALGELPLDKMR